VLLRITMAAVISAVSIMTSTPLLHNGPREPGPEFRSFVAWSPDNLPRDVETTLDELPGVKATTVRAGIDWMTSSHRANGSLMDHPPAGFSIPLEMLVVKPKEYSRFVAPADRATIQALDGDDVALARTEAELRGAGRGLRLSVGRTLRVTGLVSDHSTQGYEGLLPAPAPASWTKASRFLLIRAKRSVSEAQLRRVIGSKLASGQKLRVHSQSQARYLRYADAVQPPLMIKKNFGEFSARPTGGGYQLDDSWMHRYLRRESVPLLGSFTCNRKLFPQLRGAMSEIRAKGLSHLIDPTQFAGCFNPRLIPSAHSTQLSHHAWGIAVDINSRDNPFGARPDQDPRIVKIMRRWGLTWGGAWLVPDGMHFEWVRFHRKGATPGG
jgi:D-alanyl-D-alanine carboxypeptidase